ncbi:MAG: MarR family transcriptional regulator [Ilumatobacteraceae bacterium]|nr:MarR family transcriptional regulator [Ilumatobacteraceae bacterium]
MTASEVSVLGMLARADGALSPTRLQTLVIQSPGGLTKTLRRLEDARYVRRRADAKDRRSLLVELTATGRRAAMRATRLVHAHYAQVLEGIDPGERQLLTVLLRRIIDGLEVQSGQRTAAVDAVVAG